MAVCLESACTDGERVPVDLHFMQCGGGAANLDRSGNNFPSDVVTVERPAANATISTVVTAIGDALDAASAEVAAAVAARVDAAIATRTRNTP